MCERRSCQFKTLAVLLPASSVGCSGSKSRESYVQHLCTSVLTLLESNPAVKVVCGMDDLDPARPLAFDAINRHSAALDKRISLHTFKTEEALARSSCLCSSRVTLSNFTAAPICWMWGELAQLAVRNHCADFSVLLGDDVEVSPTSWAHLVTG